VKLTKEGIFDAVGAAGAVLVDAFGVFKVLRQFGAANGAIGAG